MRCLYVWALILITSHAYGAANPVEIPVDSATTTSVSLATNISSAFSSDTLAGTEQNLLPHIECIFTDMKREYAVHVMPWRRIYQDIKSNRIDGFFTAIPMRQVDSYAMLSAPLVLESWYWFWREGTSAPESWREGYKLGSILGSQQETWLDEAGYNVDMSANNLPQLLKLLQSKRIDVFLADREHFMRATKELKLNPDHFNSRFFRYVPLGVYFNDEFLEHNRDFLGDFNKTISRCTSGRFVISEYEKAKIQELLSGKIERWKNLPKLESTIRVKNIESIRWNEAEINERDKQWSKAFNEDDFSYPIRLTDAVLSAHLREIKKQSADMITEIIITDARGLNVAISDMTSDYWQGDEKKFTEAYAKPASTFYFDDIIYDESTRRFQVQLSVPLYSREKPEPLGVMIFGVDVEKALSRAQ